MASIITIAGEKLFAAKAQANEQLDIDTFIFANVPGQDATAPISREEGLPSNYIVHQQIVQQVGRINDNVVVYSTVLDSVTGPFEFNWVGLYSSVNNTLVAINHIPTTPKTATAAGVAGNTLNRNFGIEYSGIADLTGITVAPETWQLDFTARLQGMDDLTRNLAKDLNGADSFIDDGFKVEPRETINTFKVTPGVGYINGLRVEQEVEHILNVDTYPKYVYVDAWLEGDADSTWKPKVSYSLFFGEKSDYTDANGRQHYVTKLARLDSGNEIEDLRLGFGLDYKLINDISQEHVFPTLLACKNFTRVLPIGKIIKTNGYHEEGLGSNVYIVVPEGHGVVDGGRYIDLPNSSAQLMGLFLDGISNIYQFGVKFDGSLDDSKSFDNWLRFSGLELKGADKKIDYFGSGVTHNFKGDLKVDFGGLEVINKGELGHKDLIEFITADDYEKGNVEIKNITFDCNYLFTTSLRVSGSDPYHSARKINIENVKTSKHDNAQVSTPTTTSGIICSLKSDVLEIKGNSSEDIRRTKVNPLTVNSSGMIFTNIGRVANINNCEIKGVTSPEGDADADGMLVYCSSESSVVNIKDSEFSECKGRFIKQKKGTTNVNNNKFTISGDIISSFRMIDKQGGNCKAYNNDITVENFTGGSSASLVLFQSFSSGPSIVSDTFKDNKITLNRDIKYCVRVDSEGEISYEVDNSGNQFYTKNGSVVYRMNYVDAAENIDELSIKCNGNFTQISNGRLLTFEPSMYSFMSDDTEGPIFSEKLSIEIKNNINKINSLFSDLFSDADGVFYAQDILLKSNSGFRSVKIKGLSLQSIKSGCDFKYDNDGGDGGLIDAPQGYNRYVAVKTDGESDITLTKSNGNSICKTSKDFTPSGHVYSGVVI